MLDLFARLHRSGTTIVAVLHDLNQAARYATHLIVMKDGAVVAADRPAQVLTEELVHEVFELNCLVIDDPASGTPLIVPTDGEWR
jgi:iron complex transport system ATP-binding protein